MLDADLLEIATVEQVPAGALAWIGGLDGSEGQLRPILAVAGDQPGQRLLFDIGGSPGFGIWNAGNAWGNSAAFLTGWKLEVDPQSAVALHSTNLAVGHAFISQGTRGLIGRLNAGPGSRQPAWAISTDGLHCAVGGSAALSFSRWRIVHGEAAEAIWTHG